MHYHYQQQQQQAGLGRPPSLTPRPRVRAGPGRRTPGTPSAQSESLAPKQIRDPAPRSPFWKVDEANACGCVEPKTNPGILRPRTPALDPGRGGKTSCQRLQIFIASRVRIFSWSRPPALDLGRLRGGRPRRAYDAPGRTAACAPCSTCARTAAAAAARGVGSARVGRVAPSRGAAF